MLFNKNSRYDATGKASLTFSGTLQCDTWLYNGSIPTQPTWTYFVRSSSGSKVHSALSLRAGFHHFTCSLGRRSTRTRPLHSLVYNFPDYM